ncbi:FhaA domain-containing protein [Aeromicrobium sp. NPDC092404]|uniref:FhaA domain-containing protein n=1 Tax=Aeromicrobium sp. NPDC092404 TaxID=3154976 RepID=UPI0034370F78
MTGTLSALASNLLIVVLFVAVVWGGLRIAQSIFGVSSKKAAASEVAAKLVAYPTGSSAVLRRRFVRALTGQHVVMPSGERLAFAELTVRVAPEDLERLDPEGDLDRLGEDGAKLYLAHAERAGWAVPDEVRVIVEVDPGLRSGWVPPARGSGRADPARREPERTPMGWDVVGEDVMMPKAPAADPARTMSFPALVPDLEDSAPTMNVAAGLRLERGGRSAPVPMEGAVLGRLPESPLRFEEPQVSYRHAAIRLNGTTWEVKDLGSTNGTTVDGQRIDDWTPVRTGSVVGLAGVDIVAATDTAGTVHLQGLTSH